MHALGIAFGVFDGLHEGHRYFLSSAAEKCGTLIVAVAPDGAASILKGRAPKHSLEARMAAVSSFNPALVVVIGDAALGSWKVLKVHKPDVAILGYDQQGLAKELHARSTPYIYASAYEPEHFKSSILNGEEKKPHSASGS